MKIEDWKLTPHSDNFRRCLEDVRRCQDVRECENARISGWKRIRGLGLVDVQDTWINFHRTKFHENRWLKICTHTESAWPTHEKCTVCARVWVKKVTNPAPRIFMMHGWCTDGARFWEKSVQILTIIYPQIATEPGPRRDLGGEHNTVQNYLMSWSDNRFLKFDIIFEYV